MRAAIGRWFEMVRNGFWFVPMVMLAASAALAVLLLQVDRQVDPGIKSIMAWAYSGGPEGARSLLSTIAGSMITAASVTFSLASVALSIASQQYGSRVLRNFMRDRITQVLLGTFVATFIYSVLVVRTIRGSDFSGGFVPAISVTVAIILSLASLVLLVYFIHHVSASIQASRIIRVIAEDLEGAIPKLYPSEKGKPFQGDAGVVPTQVENLTLQKSGYLQTVDVDTLLEMATAGRFVVKVNAKPGDHILVGSTVAEVRRATDLPSKDREKLAGCFFVDRERTPAQDIRYQFQQLTDVIVRSLSPGINDPFTAINGIDELTTALLLFTKRARVKEERQDENGALRVTVSTASVGEILRDTVGHIMVYASSDPVVMQRLHRALNSVEPALESAEDLAVVRELRVAMADRGSRENE